MVDLTREARVFSVAHVQEVNLYGLLIEVTESVELRVDCDLVGESGLVAYLFILSACGSEVSVFGGDLGIFIITKCSYICLIPLIS